MKLRLSEGGCPPIESPAAPLRLTPLVPARIIQSMSDPAVPRNLFFPLAAFASVLFIVTILALVAGVFGDSARPSRSSWKSMPAA